MTTRKDVEQFLTKFHIKMEIFGIFIIDRNKNQQLYADLDVKPSDVKNTITAIEVEDYSEGPIPDEIFGGTDLWVFGKDLKDKEIYIKISLGKENSRAICISFHIAEHPMQYPFRNA